MHSLTLPLRASSVSTAVYGHPTDQAAASVSSAASSAYYGAGDSITSAGYAAASSVSSLAGYASAKAQSSMDATKDYLYSTWDDNRLRAWLEDHGVETKPHHSRTDLLGRVNEVWHAKVNDPIYHSWSDNYLKSWLVAHGILHPPHERDRLIDLMKKNYWDAKDTVFSGWDKESMRQWLVSEGVISSDAADLSREKYSALLADVSRATSSPRLC